MTDFNPITAKRSQVLVKYLIIAMRLAVGLAMLWAAVRAIAHPYDFLAEIYSLNVVGFLPGLIVATAVPWLMLFTAVALLSNVLAEGAFLAAILLTGCAVCVNVMFAHSHGQSIGKALASIPFLLFCGCFVGYAAFLFKAGVFSRRPRPAPVERPAERPARRMAFRLAYGGAVLAIAASVAAFGLAFSRNRGPLVFETRKIVAKDLTRHQALMQTFEFTNKGDRTVKLTRITPACGCILVVEADKTVAPGHHGIIKVQLTTTGITERDGKRFSVFVTTDAPEQELIELLVDMEFAQKS